MLEKGEQQPLPQPVAPSALGLPRCFSLAAAACLLLITLRVSTAPRSHVPASAVDRQPDFSSLHHAKQCPNLSFITLAEFADRRTALGSLLRGPDRQSWGVYISEPSPNTLYYTNLSTSDWYLSERPWVIAITPEGPGSHLSVLTPAFETSRSQRLPFALSADEFAAVSWVAWQEAEDPYRVLVEHLERLRDQDGASGAWTVHLEENVRQFVSAGLQAAGQSAQKEQPTVALAALVLREQRMRKTENELAIQRCAGKVTIAALRAVRPLLKLGMTEKAGERLILAALTAAGLTELDSIVLFGENAALPHASAGDERTLHEGDLALFDVGGALGGYFSDYTRTMLPDPPKRSSFFGMRGCQKGAPRQWPSERAELIWRTVREGQEAALKALETSVVHAADVDRAARDVLTSAGFGQYFTHRVGHGIGLQVHEHPYLNSGNVAQTLQPGETFSNEPGIYIEGKVDPDGGGIGVRLEDMVRKTADGWELLSGEPLAESPWKP